ncbi:hypothetical protein EB093_03030 [bacterium]|nr:hypothetical protein [bacterium]
MGRVDGAESDYYYENLKLTATNRKLVEEIAELRTAYAQLVTNNVRLQEEHTVRTDKLEVANFKAQKTIKGLNQAVDHANQLIRSEKLEKRTLRRQVDDLTLQVSESGDTRQESSEILKVNKELSAEVHELKLQRGLRTMQNLARYSLLKSKTKKVETLTGEKADLVLQLADRPTCSKQDLSDVLAGIAALVPTEQHDTLVRLLGSIGQRVELNFGSEGAGIGQFLQEQNDRITRAQSDTMPGYEISDYLASRQDTTNRQLIFSGVASSVTSSQSQQDLEETPTNGSNVASSVTPSQLNEGGERTSTNAVGEGLKKSPSSETLDSSSQPQRDREETSTIPVRGASGNGLGNNSFTPAQRRVTSKKIGNLGNDGL